MQEEKHTTDGVVGVVIQKWCCAYGEVEKVSKYIVGEGIYTYVWGEERRSPVS